MAVRYSPSTHQQQSQPQIALRRLLLGLVLGAVTATEIGPPDISKRSIYGENIWGGLGLPDNWLNRTCINDASKGLGSASEFDKAASSAATTILTLVPALLTFAPLPAAPLRELLYLSSIAAFWTALMRLGLPVSNSERPPIDPRRIKSAESLSPGRVLDDLGRDSLVNTDPNNKALIKELSRWIFDHSRKQTLKRVFVRLLVFSLLHILVLYILGAVLELLGPLRVLWLCNSDPWPWSDPTITWSRRYYYVSWLVGASFFTTVLMLYWNSSKGSKHTNEIFHITVLTKDEAQCLQQWTCGDDQCDIWKAPPPLSVPIWKRLRARFGKARPKSTIQSGSNRLVFSAFFLLRYPCLPGHSFPSIKALSPIALASSLVSQFTYAHSILQSKHPTVVVLRLSADASTNFQEISHLVAGACGAIIFILLTFIFGSIYSVRLFPSLAFIFAFCATLSVARLFSLYLLASLQKDAGLLVIECRSQDEMRAVARLLCALPFVVAWCRTAGYAYADTRRLDFACEHSRYGGLRATEGKRLVCALLALFMGIIAAGVGFLPTTKHYARLLPVIRTAVHNGSVVDILTFFTVCHLGLYDADRGGYNDVP